LTVAGLTVLVVGFSLMSTLHADTTALGYIARVMWVGLGMGLFQSPNNSAIMGAVPRERLGIASGLMSLTRTLGQTTGVALIGASWAALVHYFDHTHAIDAMSAPTPSQLQALCWTARGISLLLLMTLSIAIWGWRHEHNRTSQ
jgi:MFS family permease